MIKYINKHKYLFLALIIYIGGLVIEKRQTSIVESDINIEKFENVLYSKEETKQNIVDSLSAFLDDNKNYDFSSNFLFTDKQLQEFDEAGLTFLVYSNDTLKYWTDNYFDVPTVFSEEIFSQGCNKIGSFWVDITTKYFDEYCVIGLFRIKAEYKIQNKFLKNSFQDDLSLSNNISISLIPLSYGIDVKNNKGDYLLTLVPNSKVVTDYNYSNLVNVLYLLAFVILLIYAHVITLNFYSQRKAVKRVLGMLFVIAIVRILMIIFSFPLNIYSQNIFDSHFFSGSIFSRTLGDLFFNLLCFLFILYHLLRLVKEEKISFTIKNQNVKNIISVSSVILTSFIILFGFSFIKKFIYNSNFSFDVYSLLNLTIYSYVGFVNISLVIGGAIYLFFRILKLNFRFLEQKQSLINIVIGVFTTIVVAIFLPKFDLVQILSLLSFSVIILYFIKKKYTKSIYFYGILALISALTITFVLNSTISTKQAEKDKLLIVELTNERDDVAELLLKDISKKLDVDQTMLDYSQNPSLPNLELDVKEYLTRRYFKSYWNKYNVTVDYCENTTGRAPFECNSNLSDLMQKNGDWVFENVVFVSQSNGRTFYVLIKPYTSYQGDSSVFYITLAPRLYPSNIGYPELLLDESAKITKLPEYSYAKYENYKLVSNSGSYNYPLNGKNMFASNDEFKIIVENSLHHLVYNLSDGNFIVLTNKRLTLLQSVVVFSYVFLLFIVMLMLTFLVLNINKIVRLHNLSFRTKLIVTMLLVLGLSFTLVGTVTVMLNVRQFKAKYKQEILEKVQEINISLQQKYVDIDDFSEINSDVLASDMRKFAEVFGIDINLYDNDGFLISTSRPEIYYLDIIGKRMSSFAHYKIKYNTLVKFILDEEISELKYNSAYALISKDLKHKAVVNMPYFINPEQLRLEISNLLVSIINIYVVLFVIALILSVLTAEQIISPLIVLHNKFKKLELGKKHERIEYKRKDEIGQLVLEYNNMVDKLQESIEKLSKSERESAWRDMAKQIAHEIKNPLTPMKLSIQLLMKSWENQDSDFDVRLNNVSVTLITQIETLRKIAEEFSDFAKMPKSQKQVINLANKVEEVCKLYENTENLEVSILLKNYKDVYIVADERQISRALINLIKNGIQSIPEGVKGLIKIEMDVLGKKAILKINDNGSGIPDEIKDKLFTPSFTTKSSGMGLGLAMVKNIIDNAEGKISFNSELGKGTTFIIEFPLLEVTDKTNI